MRSEPGYLGEERTASTKILTWDEPGVFKEATNCVAGTEGRGRA